MSQVSIEASVQANVERAPASPTWWSELAPDIWHCHLLDRIASRQAVVGVIGLGNVGLPLAVAFAEAGFRVVGIDVDAAHVVAINRGCSYVQDVPSAVLARCTAGPDGPGTARHVAAGTLCATAEYDALAEVDAVLICLPTPLTPAKEPDLSYVLHAMREVAARLRPGLLVVLESTTYPGTTQEVVLPCLEAAGAGSLRVGTDFFLAFSPERIDPGRSDFTLRNTPKVIGGATPRCFEAASALYRGVVETVVPVSSPRVAEMVKMLENTFRAVNIALVNEFAIECDQLGIDVWEVIEAARTKPFGFTPFYPGPGLGGHCIPVDPHYLAWKLKTLNYHARFIQLAAEINHGMPRYVLGKITDGLNEFSKALKGARVLVLGVAYKPNIGDLRESPALDVIRLLFEKGAAVAYHDPYVPSLELDGHHLSSIELCDGALECADCVVITTHHSSYDWDRIARHSTLIVDTRNATRHVRADRARIVRL